MFPLQKTTTPVVLVWPFNLQCQNIVPLQKALLGNEFSRNISLSRISGVWIGPSIWKFRYGQIWSRSPTVSFFGRMRPDSFQTGTCWATCGSNPIGWQRTVPIWPWHIVRPIPPREGCWGVRIWNIGTIAWQHRLNQKKSTRSLPKCLLFYLKTSHFLEL